MEGGSWNYANKEIYLSSIGPGWYPRNGYFVAPRYAGYLDRTGCHRYHTCRRILQRGMDDRVLAIATS